MSHKHNLYFKISSGNAGSDGGYIYCEMEFTFTREMSIDELYGALNKIRLAELLQVDPDRLTIITPEEYERRYEDEDR